MKKSKIIPVGFQFMLSVFLLIILLKVANAIRLDWWFLIMMFLVPLGLFIAPIVYGVISAYRNPPFFTNSEGKFNSLDIAYDTGSIRPNMPGVLKHDYREGWFIVWDDGFEWKISSFNNIKKY